MLKPITPKAAIVIAAVIVTGAVIWSFNNISLPPAVVLDVPYTPQVFNGNWVAPWDEACEEASITMVDRYYAGKKEIPPQEAIANMEKMFPWETETFGMNHDTDAEQTRQVIANHSNFAARVKRNPRVLDIKREIFAKHPVIALVNMFTLYREQDLGDSYHVLVIIGYDDTKQEFIVHDPGRQANMAYAYDRLMGALHDFDPKTKEASGTPTVLFTSP